VTGIVASGNGGKIAGERTQARGGGCVEVRSEVIVDDLGQLSDDAAAAAAAACERTWVFDHGHQLAGANIH